MLHGVRSKWSQKGILKQIRQAQFRQSHKTIDNSTKAVSYRQTHTQIT